MKISTNYAIPVLSSRFQSAQKRSEQINNVSFEGSKKSDDAKRYLIYTPMILATLGLGGCKNSRSPEDMPQAHWDMIIAQDDNIEKNAREIDLYDYKEPIQEDMDYESMKDTTNYNPIIDKFMKEDKSIVNVDKWESDNPNYVNSYKIIGADGYNKNGKKVRQIIIHANEPSISCAEPTYCPTQGIEKIYYYPDKTITEYYTNDGNEKLESTDIEYKGNFTLNGKGGYHKFETIYEEPSEDVARVETYEKGEAEYSDGIPFAKNKKYHKQIIEYDANNKKTSTTNYRPNEYNEIVYSKQ